MKTCRLACCLAVSAIMGPCTASAGTLPCIWCSRAAARRPTSPSINRVPSPSTRTRMATILVRLALPWPRMRTSPASSRRTRKWCCCCASTRSHVRGSAASQAPATALASMPSELNSRILPRALIAFSVAISLSSSLALGWFMMAMMRWSESLHMGLNNSGALAASTPRPYTLHCRRSALFGSVHASSSTGMTCPAYLALPAGECSSRSSTTHTAMRRSSAERLLSSRGAIWPMMLST
mmetsp:Transcript_32926/g.72732  ORF Transcript_32926/g.72732 Transcript_32926/m.72732 type:complete len:238 (-) Transcript_32926:2794-3507(-)